MSLPDSPIKTKEKDRLNRASMAKHVARLVNDLESKDSFVVGIEGEWGSGKSSFINFVCEEIDPTKAEIIFFNPWNFSSQDQLIEDFFNALLEAVEKVDAHNQVIDNLKKYKRKLKNVEINPSFMGFGIGSWRPEISLSSLRGDLEKSLKQLDKKIMIVIDDIDRLDTKETLAIFKLVKVTANFPNCIFFLAYDRKRVVQRIDEATNKSGDDYLKKIIQTTFRLPTINKSQLKDMFFEHLNTVLKDIFGEVNLNTEDSQRWNSILYHGFTDIFQNIRDLKRFASSLKLNLSVIGKHEVNVVDFVVLETIRVFAPDFYDEIPKNQWIFTQKFYGLSYASDKDKRPEAYKKITEETLSNNPAKDKILAITEEIFPQLNFNTNYGSDWEQQWTGNKQVCSESKFDTYFQLSVSSNEISEEEFEEMIQQVESKEAKDFLKFFKELDSENKLRNFLKKTHDRFDRDFANHPKFFTNIAVGLFSIIENVDKQETKDLFDFGGVERQSQRLVWRLSEKLDGEDTKYDFLKNILSLPPVLYRKVNLLRVLKREKTGSEKHLAEMSNAIQRSINDLLPEMQKAIDDDTLKNLPNADHTIWGFMDWGKADAIKGYIQKLAQSDEDIFVLLDWLKSSVDSSNRGRYYRIDKDAMAKFVELTAVEETLSKLDTEKLTDKQKELYDLYFEKPEFDYD